ncbi:unnamed protein product, partial [Amoebophrya sp. A120]
ANNFPSSTLSQTGKSMTGTSLIHDHEKTISMSSQGENNFSPAASVLALQSDEPQEFDFLRERAERGAGTKASASTSAQVQLLQNVTHDVSTQVTPKVVQNMMTSPKMKISGQNNPLDDAAGGTLSGVTSPTSHEHPGTINKLGGSADQPQTKHSSVQDPLQSASANGPTLLSRSTGINAPQAATSTTSSAVTGMIGRTTLLELQSPEKQGFVPADAADGPQLQASVPQDHVETLKKKEKFAPATTSTPAAVPLNRNASDFTPTKGRSSAQNSCGTTSSVLSRLLISPEYAKFRTSDQEKVQIRGMMLESSSKNDTLRVGTTSTAGGTTRDGEAGSSTTKNPVMLFRPARLTSSSMKKDDALENSSNRDRDLHADFGLTPPFKTTGTTSTSAFLKNGVDGRLLMFLPEKKPAPPGIPDVEATISTTVAEHQNRNVESKNQARAGPGLVHHLVHDDEKISYAQILERQKREQLQRKAREKAEEQAACSSPERNPASAKKGQFLEYL